MEPQTNPTPETQPVVTVTPPVEATPVVTQPTTAPVLPSVPAVVVTAENDVKDVVQAVNAVGGSSVVKVTSEYESVFSKIKTHAPAILAVLAPVYAFLVQQNVISTSNRIVVLVTGVLTAAGITVLHVRQQAQNS